MAALTAAAAAQPYPRRITVTSSSSSPANFAGKKPTGTPGPQSFGRVDADGNVWVRDGEGERMIGGYPDGVPEDPYALYVRRYQDLEANINLFQARLPSLSARDIDSTLKLLQEQLVEPAVVGDIGALRDRVAALATAAEERKAQITVERAQAKEDALASRTLIVEGAEKIAGQDPERTQWKNSGQELRSLLDEWKEQQRRGPRLDKSAEDGLWKRFSAARTLFDRNRRQFFAALDESQNEAKKTKERLIAEAETLQDSDDWGPTSGKYRDLMDQWRRAGRAPRKIDDALWARFRGAQQVFFDRRRAHDLENDAKFAADMQVKVALVEEAEALLPVKDIAATKEALRGIQDRWEEAGRLPNRDGARVEQRLRAVENALRDAEQKEWERSNPETQARAVGMFSQLQESISELQAQLDAANAAGDEKLAGDISDALATKQAWLDQVQKNIG